MKLLLHYLKFDFLRWRWTVVVLWGLVVVHTAGSAVAEWAEWENYVEERMVRTGRYVPPEPLYLRVLQDVLPVLANATMIWAVVMAVYFGAADSPVRGRTWLMTRAGDRRRRVAGRLGFVFLAIVLPLALGYAVLPALAGFDAGTVLHAFWLAVKVCAPVLAAVWLWARAWPHVGGLLTGLGVAGALAIVAEHFEVRLPAEWRDLPPSWLVMVGGPTLPAFLCFRARGRRHRAWSLALVAGSLLPFMALAGLAVSTWLRSVFPGPLERAAFAGVEGEWTLGRVEGSDAKDARFADGGVPLTGWALEPELMSPSIVNMDVQAACWKRAGTETWSDWRWADGTLRQDGDGRVRLEDFEFTKSGLSGVEHLDLRLRVLVVLVQAELAGVFPAAREFSSRGHGWTYGRVPVPGYEATRFYERGRLAVGMGIDELAAWRTKESVSTGDAGWRWGGSWEAALPGSHFGGREWGLNWMRGDAEVITRAMAAPTRMVLLRREACVRTVRVNGLTVTIPLPKAVPAPVPRAEPRPVLPKVEPFEGYAPTTVWPRAAELPVPAVEAPVREVTYFLHWLKGRHFRGAEESPPPEVTALVAAWGAESLEIAALEKLRGGNVLLAACRT